MAARNGISRRHLGNVLLVVASVLITVSLVEAVLLFAGFPTDRGIRTTHPPNFRQTRRHLEYEYTFATNSLGLRNPEISKQKPAGRSRILLAGDSFVEGIGMNEDSTISAFLERELSPSGSPQVINGGLQATGIFEQGRLVRLVGYGLGLDGILFFVFDNDVFDARAWQRVEAMSQTGPEERSGIRAIGHSLWPRAYTVSSLVWSRFRGWLSRSDVVSTIVLEAEARGISAQRIEQWKAGVISEYGVALREGMVAPQIFSLSLVSPDYWSGSIDLDQTDAQQRFAKVTELLSVSVADARDRGIEVGVVYIPSKFQYDPRAHSKSEPWVVAGADIRPRWLREKTPIRERLQEWAARTDVRYLDLTPYYREATERGEILTWLRDEHLNVRGNQYTAAVVADWLRRSDGFRFLQQ